MRVSYDHAILTSCWCCCWWTVCNGRRSIEYEGFCLVICSFTREICEVESVSSCVDVLCARKTVGGSTRVGDVDDRVMSSRCGDSCSLITTESWLSS